MLKHSILKPKKLPRKFWFKISLQKHLEKIPRKYYLTNCLDLEKIDKINILNVKNIKLTIKVMVTI